MPGCSNGTAARHVNPYVEDDDTAVTPDAVLDLKRLFPREP